MTAVKWIPNQKTTKVRCKKLPCYSIYFYDWDGLECAAQGREMRTGQAWPGAAGGAGSGWPRLPSAPVQSWPWPWPWLNRQYNAVQPGLTAVQSSQPAVMKAHRRHQFSILSCCLETVFTSTKHEQRCSNSFSALGVRNPLPHPRLAIDVYVGSAILFSGRASPRFLDPAGPAWPHYCLSGAERQAGCCQSEPPRAPASRPAAPRPRPGSPRPAGKSPILTHTKIASV